MLKRNKFFIVVFILGFITLFPTFSKYQELVEKNKKVKDIQCPMEACKKPSFNIKTDENRGLTDGK